MNESLQILNLFQMYFYKEKIGKEERKKRKEKNKEKQKKRKKKRKNKSRICNTLFLLNHLLPSTHDYIN